MSHALALWRRTASDKRRNWLLHVHANPFGRVNFILTANLANHDHAFGLLIAVEHGKRLDEIQTLHRIATNTNARALTNSNARTLPHRLIGQRAGAANNSNGLALLGIGAVQMNVARHNSNFASAFITAAIGLQATRRNHAGTIWTNQRDVRIRFIKHSARAHHVLHGHAFSNATDQRNARVGRFKNCVGRKWRRNKNHGRVGAGLAHRMRHRVEHGQPIRVLGAALAGRGAANHLGSVIKATLGVGRACGSSNSLTNHTCCGVDQNAHCAKIA